MCINRAIKQTFLVILSSISFGQYALAGVVNFPGGDGAVVLRDRITIPNDTGKDVNDLHLEIFQKEPDIYFEGGTVKSDIGDIQASSQAKHKLTIDFNNFTLNPGGEVVIEWALDLSAHNKRWAEWYWTKDGKKVGDRNKGHGHAIRDPKQGGNGGGGPNGPGQDGGGGIGNWVHDVEIFNLYDKDVTLENLYLLATMTNYDTLDDIDWTNALQVVGGIGVIIGPDGSWLYSFETTGLYIDGHIYYKYDIVDDRSAIIGDHPITIVPLPSALLLFGTGMFSLFRVKKERAVIRSG